MPQIIPILIKVVQFTAAAYSVYSGVKAQSDAKKAREKAAADAADRNARRNYRNAAPAVTLAYGMNRIAGPFMYIENLSDNQPVTFLGFIKSASHEIDGFLDFYLDEDVLNVPPLGGPVSTDTYFIKKDKISQAGFGGALISAHSEEEREVTKAEWDTYPETGQFTAFDRVWDRKFIKYGEKYQGTVELYPFDGSQTTEVRDKLIELGATQLVDSDTFEGMAGFIILTHDLTRDFPDAQGNFSARFRGKKIETTPGVVEYSTNPAYIARDYLREYQAVTNDEIDQERMMSSAEVCDALITVKSGDPVPNYSINGLLTLTDPEHRQNLRSISDSMAGFINYASGRWSIEAGAWVGLTQEDTYSLDDFAGESEITLEARGEDRPNIVKGKIYSPDHHDEQIEYPSFEWEREEGEPERILELNLDLVNDHRVAQRIAKIRGMQSRAGFGASIPLRVIGLRHKVGDVCEYELPRMGGETKICRITNLDRQLVSADEGLNYRVTHVISETSSQEFEWDAFTEEKDLPPSGLAFSSISSLSPNGASASVVHILPIPDDPLTTEVDESTPGSSTITASWNDPDGGTIPLMKIRARIIAGGTEIGSYDVDPGVEALTQSFDYQPDLLTIGLRAVYDDNTTSAETVSTVTVI